jgi:hypothetical protein
VVANAVLTAEPSLVIVDDPTFDAFPGRVPVLVVQETGRGPGAMRMIVEGDEGGGLEAEVTRRLARGEPRANRFLRRSEQLRDSAAD